MSRASIFGSTLSLSFYNRTGQGKGRWVVTVYTEESALEAGNKLGRTGQRVKKQLPELIFSIPSLGTMSAGCFHTKKENMEPSMLLNTET